MSPHDKRRWSFHEAQYRLHTFCGYAAIVGFGMVAYVVLCEVFAR